MESKKFKQLIVLFIIIFVFFIPIAFGEEVQHSEYSIGTGEYCTEHNFEVTYKRGSTCDNLGTLTRKCSVCGYEETVDIPKLNHDEKIEYDSSGHWYRCSICGEITSTIDNHKYNDNNVCSICGYKKTKEDEEDEDNETIKTDDLIVESWMKENKEINKIAVSLRSEPNDTENDDRLNNNIYTLDEEVVYYIDYKNGGKDIDKKVTIQLELPLKIKVLKAGAGSYSSTKNTFTWTLSSGLEKGEAGTKKVVIKYTSFSSKDTNVMKIKPTATISVAGSKKDTSSIMNMIIKDVNTSLDIEHKSYMYGDRNTGNFRPDDTITRAEGALVIARVFDIDTEKDYIMVDFPDLDETYQSARKAIKAVTALGLLEGYPDGTFRPNKTLTVGELITIIARQIEKENEKGFEIKDEESLIKVYKDNSSVYYISNSQSYNSHWSVPYVTLLARLNLLPLTSSKNKLKMDEPITRAEVAQLMNLYLFRIPVGVSSNTKIDFPDVSKNHKLVGDILEATRSTHYLNVNQNYKEKLIK